MIYYITDAGQRAVRSHMKELGIRLHQTWLATTDSDWDKQFSTLNPDAPALHQVSDLGSDEVVSPSNADEIRTLRDLYWLLHDQTAENSNKFKKTPISSEQGQGDGEIRNDWRIVGEYRT